MPKSRPLFSSEFRAEAVRLVRQEGGTISGVAADLGCSAESLRHWIKQADLDEGRRDDGVTSDEREELTRLRRRVRILEQEREILKKAAARPHRPIGVCGSRCMRARGVVSLSGDCHDHRTHVLEATRTRHRIWQEFGVSWS